MLTDERISEIWGAIPYQSFTCRVFARAIEAEVRAEAQEPIGEVTHDAGGRWGSLTKDLPIGTKLYTTPKPPAPCQCAELEPVAYSWVSPSLERTMLGDIPPAPHIGARNVYALVRQSDAAAIIAGKDAEIERLRSKFDLLVIERDAQAVLISDQQAGVEKQTEISNNFAAQVRQQNDIIAQQAERIAELEKVAQAYEDQVAAHNKTLDELKYTGLAAAAEAKRGDELQSQVAEQSALIEKCERGLSAVESLVDESNGVTGLHLNGDVALWTELREGGNNEGWLIEFDEALAAIAAQKGGA